MPREIRLSDLGFVFEFGIKVVEAQCASGGDEQGGSEGVRTRAGGVGF